MNNQSEKVINYFYLKENSQKFYSPAGYRDWETGEDIKKYHNDEKVMREVKFISGEDHREPKSSRNLSKGGTDHREHKLNLSDQ